MTRFKALLAGGAIAAMTAATAVSVSAAPGDGATGSNPAFAQRPYHGQLHKVRGERDGWRHHGWGRHGPRRGYCGPRAGGFMERRMDVIQGLMEFTPPQKTAWNDLKSAIKSGQETLQKACDARKDQKRPTNAVERFSRIEQSMSTRLEVMHKVKPAFEKFYGSLSKKQQKAIDDMFARGPRG